MNDLHCTDLFCEGQVCPVTTTLHAPDQDGRRYVDARFRCRKCGLGKTLEGYAKVEPQPNGFLVTPYGVALFPCLAAFGFGDAR